MYRMSTQSSRPHHWRTRRTKTGAARWPVARAWGWGDRSSEGACESASWRTATVSAVPPPAWTTSPPRPPPRQRPSARRPWGSARWSRGAEDRDPCRRSPAACAPAGCGFDPRAAGPPSSLLPKTAIFPECAHFQYGRIMDMQNCTQNICCGFSHRFPQYAGLVDIKSRVLV